MFFDILSPIGAKQKIYPSMLKLNATDFCYIFKDIQNINKKLNNLATYSSIPFIEDNHGTSS